MLTRLLQRAVEVREEEAKALLLSATYFFCLLFAYFIIRPLRDQMAVAGGVRNIPWMFTGTLVLMLLVNPPFAALVVRFTRKRFVSIVYRFFMSNLLIFFLLLKLLPPDQQVWVGRAFYWWVSVFNLFVVSIFWAFMADVFRTEQSKRLFGFIGVGGTLGALAGSGVTGWFAMRIDPVNLILVSLVVLEVAVFLVKRLSIHFEDLRKKEGIERTQEQPIGGSMWAGITHLLRSPYLLGICVYMLAYTIVATVLYMQQADIVDTYFEGRGSQTAFFAWLEFAVQGLTILTQIFLTGRIIKALGVALTLTLLPAAAILGFTALGIWPTIAVFVVFQTLRRAGNFSIARPTRETLYTVVSREDKYKAKAFIDTFVYRAGDQLGAWSTGLLMWLGLSMSAIAFAAVPVAGIWLIVGYWLGRRQTEMLQAGAGAADLESQAAPVA